MNGGTHYEHLNKGSFITFLQASCLSFSRLFFRHSSTWPVCSCAAASSAHKCVIYDTNTKGQRNSTMINGVIHTNEVQLHKQNHIRFHLLKPPSVCPWAQSLINVLHKMLHDAITVAALGFKWFPFTFREL